MLVESAVAIINNGIVFFPGWTVHAEDFTARHEGAVALHIEGTSWETNRPEAMAGFPEINHPRVVRIIQVADLNDDISLHRVVLQQFIDFFIHEAREAYRVQPTGWAPFHPHQIDGMKRWGRPEDDLTYGFNAMDFKRPPKPLSAMPLKPATKPGELPSRWILS